MAISIRKQGAQHLALWFIKQGAQHLALRFIKQGAQHLALWFMRLAALGAALAASGCMATQLQTGAENVRLVRVAPRNCERLADVKGSQGNLLSGDFTSPADLDDGARSDLLNHAYHAGANVVQLVDRVGRSSSTWAGDSSTGNVTYTGIAWRCP